MRHVFTKKKFPNYGLLSETINFEQFTIAFSSSSFMGYVNTQCSITFLPSKYMHPAYGVIWKIRLPLGWVTDDKKTFPLKQMSTTLFSRQVQEGRKVMLQLVYA